MHAVPKRLCSTSLAMALSLLMAAGAVAGNTWIYPTADGAPAAKEISQAQPPRLDTLGFDAGGLSVSVDTPGVALLPCKTEQGAFVAVMWPGAAPFGEIGAPALPVVRRLFIAPHGADVSVTTNVRGVTVIDNAAAGMTLRVMPRQAPIPKIPGARKNAPFDYDPAAYAANVEYLAEPATIEEVGIVRGQRVFLLEVHPVAYSPAAQTLTLRAHIDVTIKFSGGGVFSTLNPLPGLDRVVLNPDAQAPARRGSGNYLIVVPTTFESQIASFATHKQNKGFNVNTYVVAPGTSNTTIKNYIQGLWGGPDSPDYILLVGDTQLIPYWTGGGEGTPATDLPYTCMDGASDWYPDIAIGRFPADDATELTNILDKTVYYDNGQFADPDYLKRAAFMASVDNYQISEGTHNWVIENHMVPNGYICDKLYQVTYGATTQDVRDAFNDGRFFGVYSGHGGEYEWADGPPFDQTDVRNLTNDNMYSLIMSFACVTGTYTVDECFMETWVLVPHKGAVADWGSSVTSYWTEDDVMERRWFDAIFDGEDDVPAEFGPTCNDARMRYLAEMGNGSTTRRYFEMYNLMGDPSLRYPGACSDAGTVALDRAAYPCDDGQATITISDCGLNLDDNAIETFTVTIISDAEPAGEPVVLTETEPSSAEFVGSIPLSTTDAPGVLMIAPGNTISVTYHDEDDGSGNPADVTASAPVDCTGPTISNVQVTDIQPRSAVVTFDADETVRGIIHYGLSCDSLTETATGGYGNPASVEITGLQDQTTYYFIVVAEDQAGNQTTDDNGGACYTFTTPDIPDFFTQQFDTGASALSFHTLTFTPNGSVDYYDGCVETIDALPTDPAGGTTLSLYDDDSQLVSLADGQSVSLYGQSYTSLYVGSNGYITFGTSDTTYSESLEQHFAMPRVSMLFDDLSPSDGGSVSYKQLADRIAITYQNVPEYGTTNTNTFQVEMFFNGEIRISYLGIAAEDAVVGLSAGHGVDPDFYPSDLLGMGDCGPRPPHAEDMNVETPVNTPLTIALLASDDGEPGPLSYIIGDLPLHGSLADPAGGTITTVPYTLLGGGNEVIYTPDTWYMGDDVFQFYVDDGGTPPDGGTSNIAAVSITVTPPAPTPIYVFPLDDDPGWTTEGQWAFGPPLGGGSHNGDPTAGFTGNNVYGYNLAGDYTVNMPQYSLTTTAIDCSDLLNTELHFRRWLGVESNYYDHATVEVSNDGTHWTQLWANPETSMSDSSWTEMVLDISAVADQQPTVYIRWTMGPTDSSVTYPGWNIDDVEIWGVQPWPQIPGDLDGDCDVDLNDLAIMLAHYGMTEGATYADGDIDGDGDVDLSDLSALLAHYGETCP